MITGLWINKIGIEVECGIDDRTTNRERNIPHFNSTYDGSVQTNKSTAKSTEYVSEAVKYPEEVKDLNDSVEELYTIISEINASMGLHIHVSLNNDRDYYRLASLKFHNWFINRLKDSNLWNDCDRLRKRVYNEDIHPFNPDYNYGYYCRALNKNWTIDEQLKNRSYKYRRITYMKGKYDTVEFRLFPAMDRPEQVKQAIDIVTTSINAYLREGLYNDELEASLSTTEVQTDSEASFNETIQSQVTYNV